MCNVKYLDDKGHQLQKLASFYWFYFIDFRWWSMAFVLKDRGFDSLRSITLFRQLKISHWLEIQMISHPNRPWILNYDQPSKSLEEWHCVKPWIYLPQASPHSMQSLRRHAEGIGISIFIDIIPRWERLSIFQRDNPREIFLECHFWYNEM